MLRYIAVRSQSGRVVRVNQSPILRSLWNHESTTDSPFNISEVTSISLQKPSPTLDLCEPSRTLKNILGSSRGKTVSSQSFLASFSFDSTSTSYMPRECQISSSWCAVICLTPQSQPVEPVPVEIISPELLKTPMSSPSFSMQQRLTSETFFSATNTSFRLNTFDSSYISHFLIRSYIILLRVLKVVDAASSINSNIFSDCQALCL